MSKRFSSRREAPSPAQVITDAIVARLEAGTKPWVRPWTGQAHPRPLRACGTPYRGMNFVWLDLIANMMGYHSPYWMTYRQAAALGGQVRKGEKSTIAVFYKAYGKQVENETTGEATIEARRVLRAYPVFCCDQIDGLPARFYPEPALVPVSDVPDPAHIADVEAFFAAIPAEVRHGGDRAYFHPGADYIQLPPVESFISFDAMASTRCHETAHWSGHKSRLDRTFGERFGDKAYCLEELTAELASAMLGSELNLPVTLLDNHANYIASWISALKSDSRVILTVASKAEEAANYLLGLAGRGTHTNETDTDNTANDDEAASDRVAA